MPFSAWKINTAVLSWRALVHLKEVMVGGMAIPVQRNTSPIDSLLVSDLDLKGYERAAVDYIPFPVSPQLLRAKVRAAAELHRKTRQLEEFNARMTQVPEEERRRIARELHDSVGQLLPQSK